MLNLSAMQADRVLIWVTRSGSLAVCRSSKFRNQELPTSSPPPQAAAEQGEPPKSFGRYFGLF
jgi:hypothetical protein